MGLQKLAQLLLWGFAVSGLFGMGVNGLSWGNQRHSPDVPDTANVQAESQLSSPNLPLPRAERYAEALVELQALESKPLCHRIAARLLVNNCQLVNGQDEAETRTDTDRAARDFVDAYAISLAICDLERGRFVIPPSCSPFRESALAAIPVPVKPKLHVSTVQITGCLRDFSQSDSAWNTWVNYRHQAVRFCEASLAENKKDHDIRLYQRLAKILEQLTVQVEADLEERFHSLNRKFQEASDSVEKLNPELDQLRTRLRDVDEFILNQLVQNAKESNKAMKGGLEHASSLSHLLAAMVKATVNNAAEVAAAHEGSLQVATQQANDEVAKIMAALAAVALSSASVEGQLGTSLARMASMAEEQERLEVGLDRLNDMADTLASHYDAHEGRLEKAQAKAEEILGILQNATSTASIFQYPMLSASALFNWWPYIFCPGAALVMGSYGLEPSAFRNLCLIGIGELVGFVVSTANHYTGTFFSVPQPQPSQPQLKKTLEGPYSDHDFQEMFRHGDLKRGI